MKTIGLLGGMSWESTVSYYAGINQGINQALGGLHSATIKLASVDFQEIETCQSTGDWAKCGELLGKEALALQKAGAEFLVICTNTMHKVVPVISEYSDLPILHIADATIAELQKQAIRKVGLLGTKYTLQQNFYKDKLLAAEMDVLIPTDSEIDVLNTIIFDELCQGKISAASKQSYLQAIDGLIAAGAEGIILGCTEIGLLIKQTDVAVPVFDTTAIHVKHAVKEMLT